MPPGATGAQLVRPPNGRAFPRRKETFRGRAPAELRLTDIRGIVVSWDHLFNIVENGRCTRRTMAPSATSTIGRIDLSGPWRPRLQRSSQLLTTTTCSNPPNGLLRCCGRFDGERSLPLSLGQPPGGSEISGPSPMQRPSPQFLHR